MDISSTQTIFFGVVVVANNFFAPASLKCLQNERSNYFEKRVNEACNCTL